MTRAPFAPFDDRFYAPFGGNPLLATGLSNGFGTQVPWGSTSTSFAIVPTLSVDYYINKNWSIEAICCVAPHHIQGTGSIKSTFAHTWVFPPSLLVDYHFTNFGAWQPYIGVGVNFTAYWGTRVNNETFPVFFQPSGPLDPGLGRCSASLAPTPSSTMRSVTPSWGVVGQAGLDYMFNEHWGLNLDVKYIMMEPTVHAKVAGIVPGLPAAVASVADLHPGSRLPAARPAGHQRRPDLPLRRRNRGSGPRQILKEAAKSSERAGPSGPALFVC